MEFKIRHAKPDDYSDFVELYSQPKVIAGTLQLPHPSEQLWKSRLADIGPNWNVLVAEVDGKVVGNLGLERFTNLRRSHVGYIGMAVHDAWQGKGLGSALLQEAITLAWQWLGLTRLELTVFVDNAGAIKLYEKAGFEQEGRLKQFAFRDGQLCDVFSMARVR